MEALREHEEQLRDEQAEEMAAGLKRRVEQRIMLQALSGWARVVTKDAAKHKIAEIEAQKKAALTEVKNQVGQMALGIAEKVIRKELKGDADQVSFVNKLVDEIKLN